MKTRKTFFLLVLLISLIFTACGASQSASEQKPTPTPVPGWEKFESSDVEIWLPESFNGGDMSNDLDVIVSQLGALGPEYEQIAASIKANPDAFAIWVFNSAVGDTGFLTNANVIKEKVLSSITLDTYVDSAEKQLPSGMVITNRQKVQLDRYEAMRLVLTVDIAGSSAKELMYIIKNNNIVWTITYATSAEEFEGLVPTFELSAQTFNIKS